MYRRLLLALGLAAVGASLLVAAAFAGTSSSSSSTSASKSQVTKGGTLRVNESNTDFDFVDPPLAYDTIDWSMIFTTTMQLVSFPEKTGAAGSQLYPRRRRLPDRLEGREDLHVPHASGLKFSDGSTVTAAAFQRAWERILSPEDGLAARLNLRQTIIAGGTAFLDGKAHQHLGHHGEGPDADVQPDQADPTFVSILSMQWFTAVKPNMAYQPGPERVPGRRPVLHRPASPAAARCWSATRTTRVTARPTRTRSCSRRTRIRTEPAAGQGRPGRTRPRRHPRRDRPPSERVRRQQEPLLRGPAVGASTWA